MRPGRLVAPAAAATVFLAVTAGAAAIQAGAFAAQWRQAGEGTTVQAGQDEAPAVAAILGARGHRLAPGQVAALLRPWIGEDAGRLAASLPAVFTLEGGLDDTVAAALVRAAPGAVVSRDDGARGRLVVLAGRLRAWAVAGFGAVVCVGEAVLALVTSAGVAAESEALEVLHGLGAPEGAIAGRFAFAAMRLAMAGGAAGALAGGLVLLVVCQDQAVPQAFWGLVVALPLAAGLAGWVAAQAAVRLRLGRSP